MKRTFWRFFLSFALLLFGIQTGVVAQNFFSQSDLQWVVVPNHADWLYSTGQAAQMQVQLLQHGMPCAQVSIDYSIATDELEADQTGKVTTDAAGKAVIQMGTAKKPCFRDCAMKCVVEGKTYKNHIKVGFSPDKIRPYTQMPKDFESFWQGVLDEQQKLPLSYTMEPAPAFSNEKIDCYLVKIRTWKTDAQAYVYGYLSMPKKEGKYPVVVSPPGAGVKHMDPLKTQFYVTDGSCIRFEMEIHGINPSLSAEVYKDISRAFGEHFSAGYLSNGIANRDTYYMKKVYASLVRVVDFLVTLPQWDGKNVLVQGNSQGGALSVVLAALDSRVTAIAIAHPALSDMAAYAEKGRTGGYPHFGNKYKDVKLTDEVIATLQYYDVVNFARLVKCPTYMTWGYNDNVCPPTTSYAVWNTLTCPKEKYLTPINEHWVSTETRYRQMRFLLNHCK